MRIEYLEFVTEEVAEVCAAYEDANEVKFGGPVAGLGNARTAALAGGGRVGVRAPMHESEKPVVRPYWLVDDIASAEGPCYLSNGCPRRGARYIDVFV